MEIKDYAGYSMIESSKPTTVSSCTSVAAMKFNSKTITGWGYNIPSQAQLLFCEKYNCLKNSEGSVDTRTKVIKRKPLWLFLPYIQKYLYTVIMKIPINILSPFFPCIRIHKNVFTVRSV